MKGTLKKICSSDRVKNVMKLHSFESLKLKSKSFYIIYHVVQNKKMSSTQNQRGNTRFPIKNALYSNSDQVRTAGVAG